MRKAILMNRVIKTVGLMAVLSLLAACSNNLRSTVTTFHSLPQPSGEKIVIVPMDDSLKGSLEFATYANMVGNELGKLGYRPANGQPADLVVELDYGVDDGKVFVRSYGTGFGYWGYPYFHHFGHHHFHHFWPHHRWYYGGYWGYPYGRDVRSYVKYTRVLKMNIRPNFDGAKNLYEGRVESMGRSNDLPALMPYLVQAMFENFPGVSGTTQKVVIDLEEQKDY